LGPDNRISTLGRGGSDTSAVALAAALKADRCDIYTDVDGVYTTDPRIVSVAKKLDKITYEEMLELASVGAKVLQTRSVEMAMKHHVRVQVLSSFEDKPGTLVCDEDEIVEKELVSGIAYSRDEAKITLVRVADRPGVAASIFGPLADAAVNVDMICRTVQRQVHRSGPAREVAGGCQKGNLNWASPTNKCQGLGDWRRHAHADTPRMFGRGGATSGVPPPRSRSVLIEGNHRATALHTA
jgi:aspartate kinase